MPFDTPEEALLFDIRHALRTFRFSPPRKCKGAATREWKDRLAKHALENLLTTEALNLPPSSIARYHRLDNVMDQTARPRIAWSQCRPRLHHFQDFLLG